MKKIYQGEKWKKFSSKRSDAELIKRKVSRNRHYRHLIIYEGKHDIDEILLDVPVNFSFINNHNTMLEHFELIGNYFMNKYKVILDFRKVEQLTPDAIALLISKVRDARFHRGNTFGGYDPTNDKFKLMFKQSGFYTHVKSSYIYLDDDDKNILIHKVTRQKVHPKIAKNASLLGVRHTFGNENKFTPIYKILIECMANTHNHAGFTDKGKYDWWLFVFVNPLGNITSFSFLDLGVGVFKSLPVKNHIENIMKKTGLLNNTELLPKLLNGEISSRTQKGERGKGFPLIFENSKHKNIGKLILITNDVYADIKEEKYIKIKHDFTGTFLYFELIP